MTLGLYDSYFGQDSPLDNRDQDEDWNEPSILPETGITEYEHSSDSAVMSSRNDVVFRKNLPLVPGVTPPRAILTRHCFMARQAD